MCGIFSALSRRGAAAPDYSELLETIRHRGPDGCGGVGVAVRGDAPGAARTWLGHVRLSILDLSDRGRQPMETPDARFVVSYNGEIYNYVELRDELRAMGAEFRTETDTEVLLQAWAVWGEACLPRLEGMFAFVMVDRERAVATLVRDPFGIKPLYYVETPELVLAASEILPLLRTGAASDALDAGVVYEYLRFGATNSNERTLLRDVRALPPAHLLTVDLNGGVVTAPRRYWQLAPTERRISFADATAECRERFVGNVRRHLRSDVPVGAALSGGIDSSAVVCTMRMLEPDLDLQTFSYIATEPGKSEERWVDVVHAQVGGTCHKIRPTGDRLMDDLVRVLRHQGEPFGSASVYAQFLVFERARAEGVPVTLDGQGADEILAGYWPYVGTRAAELARSGNVRGALRLVTRAAPGVSGTVHSASMLAQSLLPRGMRLAARRLAGREVMPSFLRADWFAAQGAEPEALADELIGRYDTLKEHLISTVDRGSLPNLLRYADRNSMAHSIESRVPFLTTGFAEFLLSLPAEYLLSPDGVRKHVFREAMRGILPEAIRTRGDKIGFFADDGVWLRRNATRLAEVWAELAREPMFDGAQLTAFVRDFNAGRHQKAQLVWRALVFGLWLRELRASASVRRTLAPAAVA
jgi:asparagine synthase (glutamine-hydrolysing)